MSFRLFILFIFILKLNFSVGQVITHGVKLSSKSILIGDPVKVYYELSTSDPSDLKSINFSNLDSLKSIGDEALYDSLEYYAEIEFNSKFENALNKTILLDAQKFVFQGQKYIYTDSIEMTIWNMGGYIITPPQLNSNSGRNLNVNELEGVLLAVGIPENLENPDTTQVLLPIKDILKEGKSLLDFLWILYLLIGALLLSFLYWLWKKKNDEEMIVIPDPVILPAHFIAQKQLQELKEASLWKSGKVKEHQSKLTFTIRQYLENRFGINALESTTDEIVRLLKQKSFSQAHETDLKQILQIADMVKFAKAKPPIDINEEFLNKAFEFVKQTKKTITAEEEKEIFAAKKNYDDIIRKIKKNGNFLLGLPMTNFEFQNPWLLSLLLLLPLMWYLRYKKQKGEESQVLFPHVGSIENLGSFKSQMTKYLPLLRYLGLAALIFAVARPRLVLKEEEVKAEGIDIIMVMDLSSSMLARDFDPDRLTVSKEMAKKFIDKRTYDRVGLVVFAGESFTQSPLTTDHRIVKEFLSSLESGMLEDGTAIGMGLASAVNRLKTSESESKIVILLTDGVNNAGYIKPMTAAEIAKEIRVKVYTIGVGSMGEAISPVSRRSDGRYVFGVSRVEIDEELLTEISELTGGKYFRATNEQGLEQIYSEIDQLEKTEIEVSVFKRYSEEFRTFLFFGLLFLCLEWLARTSFLRTLP